MNVYQIWCDLEDGSQDLAFVDGLGEFLGHLRESDLIAGFRITRRKLGLGPSEVGEWSIAIEVNDLAQLDAAYALMVGRAGLVEDLHVRINSMATNVKFALYRDFPDPQRRRS